MTGRGENPVLAVDSRGGVIADPTENVRELSEASNKRQDDLRELTNRLYDARLDAIEHAALLRENHAREIREIESKRLDAIRQVDVTASQTAADRALQAIQVLAATTQANAETLRSMVANTATTIATQTTGTVNAIIERIANLEKSSYQGQGRSAVGDPALDQLMRKVDALGSVTAAADGRGTGMNNLWVFIVGGVSLVGGLLGIAGVLYAVLK